MRKVFFLLSAVICIVFTQAQNIGIGTTTPASSAIMDVSSTTKGFLPPKMSQAQRDLITSPVAGLQIFNTNTLRPNFYDGQEWMNFDGTPAKTQTVNIGDSYQGGKVAYILVLGDPGYNPDVQHGLIAAASDQSVGAEWGCNGITLSGADGTALGTGRQNTIDIMAGCSTQGIAARLCGDLVLNGYSDWYLPSKDELEKLHQNSAAIGGFSHFYYWSSSEIINNAAWFIYFDNGSPVNLYKDFLLNVRAVRSF